MTFLNSPERPVRIRCDQDLLALIPHQLGHQPRDCAVLFIPVTSGGALCLRLSLPDGTEDPREYAEQLDEALVGVPHTGRATVVVYSHAATEYHTEGAFFTAAWLGLAVDRCGLRATGGYVVGPGQWWNLQRPDEPQPLSPIRDSHLNAHLVALGSCVEPQAPEDPCIVQPSVRARAGGFLAVLDPLVRPAGQHVPASLQEDLLRPVPSLEESAQQWCHALAVVGECPEEWLGSLLSLTDSELAGLAVSLGHAVLRDTLFYSWLTGDPDHVVGAHAGLQAALTRVLGCPVSGEPLPVVEADVAEALRCTRAVMGQWEGAPSWDTVETAYRILQGLDALLECALVEQPGDTPRHARCAAVHVDVVSARAQLEVYRGRALTACGLLTRCEDIAEGHASTASVLRRLTYLDIPWWSTDPRTAWPGERWWYRRHCPREG